MTKTKKHMFDDFQEFLISEFKSYCDRHNYTESNDRFVTFIIDKELIPASSVCRYTIQREFQRMSEKKALRKTQTVQEINNKYQLSEKTVWNMLRGQQKT